MEILFASNRIDDWAGDMWASVASGTFDAARVPYSIGFVDNRNCTLKKAHPVPAASGDTIWYHFRFYTSSVDLYDDGLMFAIPDAEGRSVLDVYLVDGRPRIRVYGDTTEYGGYSTVVPNVSIVEFDIEVTVNGSEVTGNLYLDQLLLSGATSLNTGGRSLPRHFTWRLLDSTNGTYYFSEFVVAAEDTRGILVTRLDPDSAGNYSGMSGSLSDLTDESVSSAVSSTADDERFSSLFDAYSGGASISAVVAVSTAYTNGAGPSSLSNFLRIGSTDYDGAAVAIDAGGSFVTNCWEVDPSDSLAWDVAGVNACELGLLSSS